MVVTTEVGGWCSAKARTGPGMVWAGTNAELRNGWTVGHVRWGGNRDPCHLRRCRRQLRGYRAYVTRALRRPPRGQADPHRAQVDT